MARGVGRQIIFEDHLDKRRFCAILSEEIEEVRAAGKELSVLAWCLMDNHAHLLFRTELADLSTMLRTTFSRYSKYFNARHDRVGTLFQDRFKSVPVTDDAQLLTVLRYIHRNPLELGQPLVYQWSSFRDYLGASGLSDPKCCLDMLGGIEQFIHFHEEGEYEEGTTASCEGGGSDRLYGTAVSETIARVLHPYSARELSLLDKSLRNSLLATLQDAGLSIRQIERATGIGRGIIANARRSRPKAAPDDWN